MLMRQSRSDNNIFLGYQSITHQSGILKDGSSFTGDIPAEAIEANRIRIQKQFDNSTSRFIPGRTINREAIESMSSILSYASEEGFTIIGVVQPVHPMFSDFMRGNPDFVYRDIAIQKLQSMFSEYGFPLYRFSDVQSYAGSENDFLDEWHYTQYATLQMFKIIAEENENILGEYVNLSEIDKTLHNATNPYAIYITSP
jgi:hypothetical protein